MVGAIALKETNRVGSTARDAAAGDLRAEASALDLLEGKYGFLTASCDNAAAAVRTMEYTGALEIFYLAATQTHYKPGKEPAHE